MEFIKASEAHEVARKSNRNTIVLEELNNIISTSAKLGNSEARVEYGSDQLEADYQKTVVTFLRNKGYMVEAEETTGSHLSVVNLRISW